MQHYDISVIIPVYRTNPEFLRQCLESVTNQFVDGLTGEVIVVCDGPQDDSFMSILHSFPITVIETEHRGVSHARNIGLEKASGTYIFFLDSDDWLIDRALADLYYFAQTNSCDLVLADILSIMRSGQEQHNYALADFVLSQNASRRLTKDILHPQTSAGNVYPKLISRKIIGKSAFKENIAMGEDADFMLQVAQKVSTLGYLHKHLYCYRRNSASAVMQFRNDYVDRIIFSMNASHNMLGSLDNSKDYKRDFGSYVAYHLTLVLVNYVCNPQNGWKVSRQRKELARILRIPLFKDALRTLDFSVFSLTRKITLLCMRMHFLYLCLAIGYIRQKQLRTVSNEV